MEAGATIEQGGLESYDHKITYGVWEMQHPECFERGIESGDAVKILQLCFAVISICQVIFMFTRAPKVAWESIYLPLAECITYFLAFTGYGVLRMSDGRIFPWARMASWVCTCPVMLGQVSAMGLIKWKSVPLNNVMIAASLVRVCMGITATVTPNDNLKWMFFFFGVTCLLFEYTCVFTIFQLTINDFEEIGSPLGNFVAGRARILRIIFHTAWTCFPVLWVLSSTGTCMLDENTSATLFMLADAACKNMYGLILWNTTWGHLNGKWDRDYVRSQIEAKEEKPADKEMSQVPPAAQDDGVKVFGRNIPSIRRSTRRPKYELDRDHKGVDRQEGRYEDDEADAGDWKYVSKRMSDRRDDRRRREDRDYDRRDRDYDDRDYDRRSGRDERDRRDDYDRRDREERDTSREDRREDRRDDRDRESNFRKVEGDDRAALEAKLMDLVSGGDSKDRAIPPIAEIMAAMQRSAMGQSRDDDKPRGGKNDSMC